MGWVGNSIEKGMSQCLGRVESLAWLHFKQFQE